MSFFKKLKDRLFRSSDRIGEGLEALVAEGDTAADPAKPADGPARAAPEPAPAAAPPSAPEAAAAAAAPETAKPGLLGRLFGRPAGEEPAGCWTTPCWKAWRKC